MKNLLLLKIQAKNFFFCFTTKRKRIGFIGPRIRPYNRSIASVRLRVYDIMITFFHDSEFLVFLYVPLIRYDLVIVKRKVTNGLIKKIERLKESGTVVVFDINVNYFDESGISGISPNEREDVQKFIENVDCIITPSNFIATRVIGLFPDKKVEVIEENISQKLLTNLKPISCVKSLIWVGYSGKARELAILRGILEDLYKKYAANLVIISDKNPKLNINIPITFIKYNQKTIENDIQNGDIFIAPRNLEDPYNLGHSFTKIGIAMASGLPVIASPIPSYGGSPALLCRSQKEWNDALESSFSGKGGGNLNQLSKKGIRYCKTLYDIEVISKKYRLLFKDLVKQKNSI